MKFKVFRIRIWSEVLYVIPSTIKYQDLLDNKHTSMLSKYNYMGEFEMNESFLIAFFEQKPIKNNIYYFKYCYEKEEDDIKIGKK